MSSQSLKIKLEKSTKANIESYLNNLTLAMPFLVNLNPAEIRKSLKMGSLNFTYSQKVLLIAKANSQSIPSMVDLDQFETDLELIKDLRSIRDKLIVLQEGIEDTLTVIGNQSLKTANMCYGILKQANKTTGNLDESLAPILESKSRKRKK
jgi:hypothetical protein